MALHYCCMAWEAWGKSLRRARRRGLTSANDRRALGEVRGMAVQTLDRSPSSAAPTSSARGQTLFTHPAAAAAAVGAASSHHPFFISKQPNSSSSSSSQRRCSNPILANLSWMCRNSSSSAAAASSRGRLFWFGFVPRN